MKASDCNFTIDLSPPGLQYTALAVADGIPPGNFTWELGFAGLDLLNGAILVDGLNEAGLSAAYLWQESAMLSGNYSADGPQLALAADDLVPYLLGNFRSVAEAVKFMSSGDLQVWKKERKLLYTQGCELRSTLDRAGGTVPCGCGAPTLIF